MNAFIDFLSFALRWTHVFAAILWVGSTYLFNFMEKSLERDETTPENVRGRLWMVHGGGFYFVEKQKRLEGKPRELHWFKYESATTWVSGALLIALVFYHGGGANLAAEGVSFGAAATAGLLTIVGGWVIYDLLVRSPLGRNELFVAVVGLSSFVGLTYLLPTWLMQRAVLVHIGGMIGTIMAANVWMRILPSQKKMLAAVAAGQPIPTNVSATGPLRSKQNSYLAIPLVLLMLSNHSSVLMDRKSAPFAVGALFLVGWAVARLFRGPTHAGEGAPNQNAEGTMVHAALALTLLVVAFGFGFRAAGAREAASGAHAPVAAKRTAKTGAAPKAGVFGSGSIQGAIAFTGAVPPPSPWTGTAECAGLHEPTIQLVRVKDGKLADVFVFVKSGLPDGEYAAPKEPVTVGQKSCEFSPRVFGAMVEQPIVFGNDDPTQHNVQGQLLSRTVPVLTRGQVGESTIDEPRVMVTLTCSMHAWMRAYAGIRPDPFFAVSADDGRFTIAKLPDGEYTVGAWHEKLGETEGKVVVSGGKAATLDLTFAAK